MVQPLGRIHGEDLIADLFEAMHDLHFVRDAVEGGDFCLALAMRSSRRCAGIVQLYDIDRREFVVDEHARRGHEQAPAPALPRERRAPRRRRCASAARSSSPTRVQSEATINERYVALGGARSLIVAPVMLAGRFLGAIELLNPLDGEPFTESEGNARRPTSPSSSRSSSPRAGSSPIPSGSARGPPQ